MSDKKNDSRAHLTSDDPPSKAALQRELRQTRESMTETVDDIKEIATEQYRNVKQSIDGVMDFREQFQNEPLVWSLGALSAGFALGYTMGYAHKHTKGSKKDSAVAHFTDSLVAELGTVGKTMVMPPLNSRIKELFGFDFSEVLNEIGEGKKKRPKRIKGKSAPKTSRPKAKKRRRAGKAS